MIQRTITAAGLIAILVILMYFGGGVMAVAALLCIAVAVYEQYHALRHYLGNHLVAWPTWAGFFIGALIIHNHGSLATIPVLMVVSLLNVIVVVFRNKPSLQDVVFSQLPLVSVVVPGMCIVSMTTIEPRALQVTLLTLLFTVPVFCDSMAYFVGKAIGGPKLCPVVSPNKTVAGAIGGMIGAMLAVAVVGVVACRFVEPSILPTWWQYVLIGVVGGVACQTGDLFASLVKRRCGIKDFSNLFPGHGGMLDRLDSILFMAVVMYCYHLFTML